MKFEALNLKDTFKVWRISFVAIIVGFTLFGLAYLITEWPRLSYDPIIGFSGFLSRNNPEHTLLVFIAILLPLVDVSLLGAVYLLKRWENDAKKYGLVISDSRVDILCEGNSVSIDICDIERFEVLPPNCEPTVFKSKWAGVGYIVSGGYSYKLYYLKNLQNAKAFLTK